MKKTLILLPLVLLLLAMRPLTQTDYVLNDTNLNLGTATVIWNGGSGDVSVPGTGTFPLTAGGDAIGVTINGTTVYSPNSGPVSVAGSQVAISWPAPNEVEITTTRGTSRPSY